MSRSATDALLAGNRGFAHRGLHGCGLPENSLAAFRAAIDADVGIECDLRLSRDGFAMVVHDADLTRMCDLNVTPESLDASALMRLRLGAGRETIPWLGDLLKLVDGKVPLLLELKYARGTNEPLCRAVAATVKNYRGVFGVMSFEPFIGAWFAARLPDIARGIVLDGSDAEWERTAKMKRSAAQFVAVEVACIAQPWVAQLRRAGIGILCWTIATADQRA
ncbi:MAG: glycerophosphodiester phosphodiesterase family protein, partial [Sphingomicrobium sp.]